MENIAKQHPNTKDPLNFVLSGIALQINDGVDPNTTSDVKTQINEDSVIINDFTSQGNNNNKIHTQINKGVRRVINYF